MKFKAPPEETALRKILLVGGCGYIGSYIYGQLKKEGWPVTIVDRLDEKSTNIEIIKETTMNYKANILRILIVCFGLQSLKRALDL